jgi:hypothetical protein
MSNIEAIATDEEVIEEGTPRPEILARAVLTKGRKLGELTVRPLTAETLSYLFEVENFFIKGMKGERVSASNANAIWSTGEFIYIHAGDPDEVAESIWYRSEFRANVRGFLSGPLNDPAILTAALPLIEEMVREYFAAQSEAAPQPGRGGLKKPVGKGSARVGKPATPR